MLIIVEIICDRDLLRTEVKNDLKCQFMIITLKESQNTMVANSQNFRPVSNISYNFLSCILCLRYLCLSKCALPAILLPHLTQW